MSLGDYLAELLDEAGDVETPVDREYARGGVTFAARPSDDVVELRLGAEIAEAARRTPDTAAVAARRGLGSLRAAVMGRGPRPGSAGGVVPRRLADG